ncbi:MAG: polyhydroxyalkanoate synthesis repressor PhaR [Proteobacteria bacterium]|nr:polyhydroxyalkanoate synthesis repressor PhaR [Pseudomonadota bacterium]
MRRNSAGDGKHVSDANQSGADAKGKAQASGERVVIKKYANRRLYNTQSSSYVTLDHLAEMVREGVDFVVYDAKSNEDITRSVLTQIIFEEESRGQNLLPIQFLRQLIGFYGDSVQSLVPTYLEMSLDAFSRQQEQFRNQFAGTFGAAPGAGFFDEQVRQNLAMFDRAMKMFTPFAYKPEEKPAPQPAPAPASETDTISEMKRQMDEMRRQIEKLAAGR